MRQLVTGIIGSTFDSIASKLNGLTAGLAPVAEQDTAASCAAASAPSEHAADSSGTMPVGDGVSVEKLPSTVYDKVRESLGLKILLPLVGAYFLKSALSNVKVGDFAKDCYSALSSSIPSKVSDSANKAVDGLFGLYEMFSAFISNLMSFAKSFMESLSTITSYLGLTKSQDAAQQSEVEGAARA